MSWEDILKNRRRNIKIPKRKSKKEMGRAFTPSTINLDRVNRQENIKRLEKLRREVDEDKEQFPMMKRRLQAFKKTYEELEEEGKEVYEEFAKDDEEYEGLTGKEATNFVQENSDIEITPDQQEKLFTISMSDAFKRADNDLQIFFEILG